MTAEKETDGLFDRPGLPEDLKFLLASYPRERWGKGITLNLMSGFWIKRHNMFRELAASLNGSLNSLKEEKIDIPGFRNWFVPRLNFLLSELDGHHQIEDVHYFPKFREAEPRLDRGFEILDSDHHLIHYLLVANAEAGNAFLEGLARGGDAMRYAADRYGIESAKLLSGLLRHLEDEEDIIIPLILDREGSDAAFAM